jgi:arsenite-transporting ATPase
MAPPMNWPSDPLFFSNPGLRLVLFGGKGGVGKTTCATAAALRLAQDSPRSSFLLVSTDPAHSLADSMAGFSLPRTVKTVELDAQASLAAFKKRHGHELREIALRGTFLDEEDISQLLYLSLPGMDELMAFLEISRWVEEWSYDCIVVDTAPTGHTLRLLTIPAFLQKWLEALDALLAKHRYMKQLFRASYCRDELDAFLSELSGTVKQMESLLRDPARCRFIPVMLAEVLSVRETATLMDELVNLRVPVTDIVINRLYPESTCPVCQDRRLHQLWELGRVPAKLTGYSLWGVPMCSQEVRGARLLDEFWEGVFPVEETRSDNRQLQIVNRQSSIVSVEEPGDLPSPEMKLLLFAGKGGVGKTTLACATAVRLASDLAGKEVLLFSTDPAHSLSACLDVQIGPSPTRISPGLTAMEIDSQAEFQTLKDQYAEELERFLGVMSPNLDLTFDREVMEHIMDLSPPGLDEVMALTVAMEFLMRGQYDVFIFDPAPTGHLIRLLELPELIDQWLKVFFNLFLKYKRVFRLPKISQRMVQMSKQLKRLKTMLHDPTRSALYAVAILTEMAFQETKDLAAACERMDVHVQALILNLATPPGECALCSALHQGESQVKGKFQGAFSGIHQTLVYCQAEPRGLERLGELGDALYRRRPRVSLPRSPVGELERYRQRTTENYQRISLRWDNA